LFIEAKAFMRVAKEIISFEIYAIATFEDATTSTKVPNIAKYLKLYIF